MGRLTGTKRARVAERAAWVEEIAATISASYPWATAIIYDREKLDLGRLLSHAEEGNLRAARTLTVRSLDAGRQSAFIDTTRADLAEQIARGGFEAFVYPRECTGLGSDVFYVPAAAYLIAGAADLQQKSASLFSRIRAGLLKRDQPRFDVVRALGSTESLVAESFRVLHGIRDAPPRRRQAFAKALRGLARLARKTGSAAMTLVRMTFAVTERTRIDALETEVEALRRALEQVARWRRGCREHDRDMGNHVRTFDDREEWKLVEGFAQTTLDRSRMRLR